MSIISEIGRKSLKVRVFIMGIYVLLITGAVSMVYPFLIMVSGTSKSGVDSPDAVLIPRFLVDQKAFYRKSVEAFFNEEQRVMQMSYGINGMGFRNLEPHKKINRKLTEQWNDFVKKTDIPFYAYELAFCGYRTSRNIQPLMLRKFKNELKSEYDNSIDKMNDALQTDFVSWNNVFIRPAVYVQRRQSPGTSSFNEKWRKFKQKQSNIYRIYADPGGFYRTGFLKAQYTNEIGTYNKANNTNYSSWNEVIFTQRYPGEEYTKQQRKDWITYVRSILNLYWIRADKEALPLFLNYLKEKYNNNITSLNKLYETSYNSFEDIKLVTELPLSGVIISDWDSFIQGWRNPETGKLHILPKEQIYIHSIPFMFRDHMLKKYGSLNSLNQSCGTKLKSINQLNIPLQGCNQLYFEKNSSKIKWEFLTRNFLAVFEYIFLQGNAIVNTIIYCSLAVLSALIINPLGAYALSRYKPRATYKVLMFLMLTMAFPPMVTSIPAFLMLRELNLLNTFFALILPGAANGYSIFLLKGFFDSLPQELYESAELDGAGEIRIFWQITMSLSKPILAVISLQAFNLAYANFMMALLICQDRKMWTLMPWLYQLQQLSCEGIVFSSLLVAAIPTFLIFVFCQNIIMRGIVVPVEK